MVLACTFLFLLFNNLGLMIINHRCKVAHKLSLKTKDESAQDPTLKQFMNDLYQSTNAKMKLTCIKR